MTTKIVVYALSDTPIVLDRIKALFPNVPIPSTFSGGEAAWTEQKVEIKHKQSTVGLVVAIPPPLPNKLDQSTFVSSFRLWGRPLDAADICVIAYSTKTNCDPPNVKRFSQVLDLLTQKHLSPNLRLFYLCTESRTLESLEGWENPAVEDVPSKHKPKGEKRAVFLSSPTDQSTSKILSSLFLSRPSSYFYDLQSQGGTMTVTMLRGENLLKADFGPGQKSDPYCIFGIGTSLHSWLSPRHQTKPCKNTLDPTWTDKHKNTSTFKISPEMINASLIVEVWDKDPTSSDPMGYGEVRIQDLKKTMSEEITLVLKPMKKEAAKGQIIVKVSHDLL